MINKFIDITEHLNFEKQVGYTCRFEFSRESFKHVSHTSLYCRSSYLVIRDSSASPNGMVSFSNKDNFGLYSVLAALLADFSEYLTECWTFVGSRIISSFVGFSRLFYRETFQIARLTSENYSNRFEN